MHRKLSLLAAAAVLAIVAAGCGSSGGSKSTPSSSSTSTSTSKTTTATTGVNPNAKETSPSGDIPDNQAYVGFTAPAAGFSVKVPEGWSRVESGNKVTFTSNLNSVTIEHRPASGPVTAASAKANDVRTLAGSLKGFKLQSVTTVRRSAGPAVRIQYLVQGSANPVTGKAVTDAVERYLFVHNGKEAVLTLSAPKGSDNVDPWRTITNSVRWTA
jgi:hypothetical protein